MTSHKHGSKHTKIYPDLPKALSMQDQKKLKNSTRGDHHGGGPPPYSKSHAHLSAGPDVPMRRAMTGGFTGGGNQKNRKPATDPTKWNKGLLSCCKEDEMNPFCLQTFCCPCVIYGRIVSEMTPQDAMFGGSKYLACCTWAIMQSCGLGCLMHRHAREAIRNKYSIKAGMCPCPDTIVTCMCPVCAIRQEFLELQERKDTPDKFTEEGMGDPRNTGHFDHTQDFLDACLAGMFGCFLCELTVGALGGARECFDGVRAICQDCGCGHPDERCCEPCWGSCGENCARCQDECYGQLFGVGSGSSGP